MICVSAPAIPKITGAASKPWGTRSATTIATNVARLKRWKRVMVGSLLPAGLRHQVFGNCPAAAVNLVLVEVVRLGRRLRGGHSARSRGGKLLALRSARGDGDGRSPTRRVDIARLEESKKFRNERGI